MTQSFYEFDKKHCDLMSQYFLLRSLYSLSVACLIVLLKIVDLMTYCLTK
jgi:hypothetical protein